MDKELKKFIGIVVKERLANLKNYQTWIMQQIKNRKFITDWEIYLDDYHLCSWETISVRIRSRGTLNQVFKKAIGKFEKANGTNHVDLEKGGIQLSIYCPSGEEIRIQHEIAKKIIHQFCWCNSRTSKRRFFRIN